MLFIVFQAGNAQYALEAREVIEVVPLVTLRPCPGAPAYIAGLSNYRGTGVPVVDLAHLVCGAPCAAYLSTRIVLTHYAGGGGRQRVIGLMAETVTNSLEREDADFGQNDLAGPGAACFGKLAVNGTGFIQRIVVERMLPRELEPMLFAEPEKPAI